MGVFEAAVVAVAVLLFAAVPGYIFKKKNMVGDGAMPALSKILLYVGQPCLTVYSFSIIEFSWQMLANIGIFALLVAIIHVVMLGGAYLCLHKKASEPIYRILTIATTFSNSAFFGIPVIKALLPSLASELIVYTSIYAIVMNLFAWTVGSAIIANDVGYIKVKSIFLNPMMISLLLGVCVFVFRINITGSLLDMIEIAGRMSTPISMIIMGMRLATVDFRKMWGDVRIYLTIAVNQLLMPTLVFLSVFMLKGIDPYLRKTLFIISACPAASIVLNYSEVIGSGQREAANVVLLSTILSIATLPLMMILLPLIN
jgi:predicted permease